MTISYVPTSNGKIKTTKVKLSGVVVGLIMPVEGGFQYQPLSSRIKGEIFPTEEQVKKSLEEDN